jgi:hypothetical protein
LNPQIECDLLFAPKIPGYKGVEKGLMFKLIMPRGGLPHPFDTACFERPKA